MILIVDEQLSPDDLGSVCRCSGYLALVHVMYMLH
jgi:hypothetical protein